MGFDDEDEDRDGTQNESSSRTLYGVI
jgi:hypothetical protein